MSYIVLVPAVSCTFVAGVWLIRGVREISCKRNELNLADKQFAVYSQRHIGAKNVEEAQLSIEQVALSREIYKNVAMEYNHCITRVDNRLIAWLLGYGMVGDVKREQ